MGLLGSYFLGNVSFMTIHGSAEVTMEAAMMDGRTGSGPSSAFKVAARRMTKIYAV